MKDYSTRIVFMGTPEFAVESLKSLHEAGNEIVGVVTAPDKPAGRGKKLKTSAVKEYATRELACPVLQPTNLKDTAFLETLKGLNAHLFIVVAFRMLPATVWQIPPKGTINLHASLLPHYRGAAPINHVLINGENHTGVTTFLIDEKIDTGKIILQSSIEISPVDDAGSLHDKLMIDGAELLVKTVTHIMSGMVEAIDQKRFNIPDEDLKTAPKIFKEDCRIDWSKDVDSIYNFIRGLSPYPGAYSFLNETEQQLKIFRSTARREKHELKTGSLICKGKELLSVAAGGGFIDLKEIQLAGKKRMPVEDFLRGYPDQLSGKILE